MFCSVGIYLDAGACLHFFGPRDDRFVRDFLYPCFGRGTVYGVELDIVRLDGCDCLNQGFPGCPADVLHWPIYQAGLDNDGWHAGQFVYDCGDMHVWRRAVYGVEGLLVGGVQLEHAQVAQVYACPWAGAFDEGGRGEDADVCRGVVVVAQVAHGLDDFWEGWVQGWFAMAGEADGVDLLVLFEGCLDGSVNLLYCGK